MRGEGDCERSEAIRRGEAEGCCAQSSPRRRPSLCRTDVITSRELKIFYPYVLTLYLYSDYPLPIPPHTRGVDRVKRRGAGAVAGVWGAKRTPLARRPRRSVPGAPAARHGGNGRTADPRHSGRRRESPPQRWIKGQSIGGRVAQADNHRARDAGTCARTCGRLPPVCFPYISHTGPWGRSAPGIPCTPLARGRKVVPPKGGNRLRRARAVKNRADFARLCFRIRRGLHSTTDAGGLSTHRARTKTLDARCVCAFVDERQSATNAQLNPSRCGETGVRIVRLKQTMTRKQNCATVSTR